MSVMSFVRRLSRAADDRYQLAGGLRRQIDKVFPGHFSFLFGELALYSLLVLVLSGTYLALFFEPSLEETTYQGAFVNLRGVEVSRAFESTLDLSFDVRGGLLVRQIHHWAALLFIAAIMLHMMRIFFTGAYRKPREGNWMIGLVMLVLAIVEGFVGYSLPDDLLSGTGLRIMSGIFLSIPVIGTWLHWMLFNGEFPGEIIMPRLFTAHILLLPGLIIALVAVHLAVVWYQKHTQFPGVRERGTNVVGVRIVPSFALKSTGLAISVTATLVLMGGLFQINPVFNYGPYEPSAASTNSQPDWYMQFVEGAIRLFPSWDLRLGNYTVPAPFWPSLVMPLGVFVVALLYPFIEQRLTGDRARHNMLQRPRDVPVRTSLGCMGLTYYAVLYAAGGDDIIADKFDIPLENLVWALRVAVLVLPPLAYLVAHRLCRRLQRADRDALANGVRTGIVEQRPDGYFVELRQPLTAATPDGEGNRPRYQGSPVPTGAGELRTRPGD